MENLMYLGLLTEEEQNHFVEYANDFKLDDFTFPWVLFVSKHPLPKKLQNVYDKMESTNKKIGILSKWLIKVAKHKGVSKEFIDMYCDAKADKKEWYDKYDEWIIEESNSFDQFDDMMELYRTTKRISRFEWKRNGMRTKLNRLSYALIREVNNLKDNN